MTPPRSSTTPRRAANRVFSTLALFALLVTTASCGSDGASAPTSGGGGGQGGTAGAGGGAGNSDSGGGGVGGGASDGGLNGNDAPESDGSSDAVDSASEQPEKAEAGVDATSDSFDATVERGTEDAPVDSKPDHDASPDAEASTCENGFVPDGSGCVGTTIRVSVGPGGVQSNGRSRFPSISADGRFIAFCSNASNLVPDDTNDLPDVFVHDRMTGRTTRASVASNGAQAAKGARCSALISISGDGRYVGFDSDDASLDTRCANGWPQAFVHDRQSGGTTCISLAPGDAAGNQGSDGVSLSFDGRVATFVSVASNLVIGDTNGLNDVFVRDMGAGTTTRVSVSSAGAQASNLSFGAAISANGRFVAFQSSAPDLVPNDTNANIDAFVRDMQLGTTTRVSIASDGSEGLGGVSYVSSLSADGNVIAFYSSTNNLVPGIGLVRGDVYVRDRQAATTTRISQAPDGSQGNGRSDPGNRHAVTGDGRWVVFFSKASNLVPGDANGVSDAFLHDRQNGTTLRIGAGIGNTESNGALNDVAISSDGRFIAVESEASNLVAGDTNGVTDIFLMPRP